MSNLSNGERKQRGSGRGHCQNGTPTAMRSCHRCRRRRAPSSACPPRSGRLPNEAPPPASHAQLAQRAKPTHRAPPLAHQPPPPTHRAQPASQPRAPCRQSDLCNATVNPSLPLRSTAHRIARSTRPPAKLHLLPTATQQPAPVAAPGTASRRQLRSARLAVARAPPAGVWE